MFKRIQSHLKNLRISLFGNKTGTFLKEEKDKSFIINYLSFYLVPRAGIEPAWVAPLVFETSASTYSAIWAFLRVQS